MGKQHATLLKDQLKAGSEYIDSSELGMMEPLAEAYGFIDEAIAQSYPAIVDECQGMADVAADVGWTFRRCMALAYGDVILEWIQNGDLGSTSCSQFVVTRTATKDGTMIHGRNLDWGKIDFLLAYPTIIVRHPAGRIPYVAIGFPGNVAPYNGINAAGVSTATNEANTKVDLDRTGRSHCQMQNEVLSTATSLDEARAFILAQDMMTATNMVVTDGDHDAAAVFEMTATHIGVRELTPDNDAIYATNHFVQPETGPVCYTEKPTASTFSRFARLAELVPKDGKDTLFSTFDPAAAVKVLRDGHNPLSGQDIPPGTFDDGGAIANNGCIYSVVFAPRARTFWIAAGTIPVPQNAYTGFTLAELFGDDSAPKPSPEVIP
jgi:hypothetical protein